MLFRKLFVDKVFLRSNVFSNIQINTIIIDLIIFINFLICFASAKAVLISPSFIALVITALFNLSITLFVVSLTLQKRSYIRGVFLFLLAFIYLSSFLLYANYAIYQGPISFGAIASVFETDAGEAFAFLESIEMPIFVYLLFFLIITSCVLIQILLKSNWTLPKSYLLSVVFVFSAMFIFLTWREMGIKKSESHVKNEIFFIHSVKRTLGRLNFTSIPLYVNDYLNQAEEFKKPILNVWQNVMLKTNNPSTFVIVIGESATTNHMSLYGYARMTTPFLNNSKGLKVVDLAIAPAAVTRDSLFRILTLNVNQEPNINLNLIGLAKKAHYETFWLSNQGRIGRHDTLTSRIANNADHVVYLNKGDFSKAKHDESLLKELDLALANSSPRKLIVLHIMGSHMNFKDRVPNRRFEGKSEDIDYYDSSILYTDFLLSKVYEKIKPVDGKLLYFSDHGLKPTDKKPFLVHGTSVPLNLNAFQVPLIFIDSTSGHKILKINSPYFMVDMMHTIAYWMNIKAEGIVEEKSIISNKFSNEKSSKYILHPITGKNVKATFLIDKEDEIFNNKFKEEK